MTKPEAAAILVDMACTLRDQVVLSRESKELLSEAVAMACGELMIDTVLAERSKSDNDNYC